MKSPNANSETVHSKISNQPSLAENSHSPSVHHEIVARHQQDEAVHNSTLEHIGVVGNQLEDQPTANQWVTNVDDDGYWQVFDEQAAQVNQHDSQVTANIRVNSVDDDGYSLVLCDRQSVPFGAEGFLQVLNDNDFALTARRGNCKQQVPLVSYNCGFSNGDSSSGLADNLSWRNPQQKRQNSPAPAKIQVKSAKHNSSFTLNTKIDKSVGIQILSVSRNGQLLVSQWNDRQLHVYSESCSHVTSIKLPDDDIVYDAVWTRRDNIVYSKWNSNEVVTMSQFGDVLKQTNALHPSYFSVSSDGLIYLISNFRSVYQSTDDGLTWSRAFNVSDGWTCCQVIKVSTDSNTDVFWTLEWSDKSFCLHVYTVDKRRSGGDHATWRDVTVPHVPVDGNSRLAYDNHTSIFVTLLDDRAVHVWSVSGQYERHLVSRHQLTAQLRCIAVDTRRHVMYVGQDYGQVAVFELTYEQV